MPPRFIDSETQHANFVAAVELLGGQRETARKLGVHETTVRDIVKGRRKLHEGFLRDVAGLLLALADEARQLERRISPAFASNLTPDQYANAGKPDGRRHGARRTVKVRDPSTLCHACGRNHAQGHRAECPNRREEWPTIDAELADMDWEDEPPFRSSRAVENEVRAVEGDS
jgi:hypothetical protein